MAGYRRTISFPVPKPPTVTASANDKSAAYRIRSASLPCRFHPLVLQLDDDVDSLRLKVSASPSTNSAASISGTAKQLARVLASLSELLHHPQAQEPLRRLGRSPYAERLLDDFLRLADAHGSFREALVSLAALQAETSAAVRRGDPARLASAARAQRRAGRELPRLIAAARAVAGKAPPRPPDDLPTDAAALATAVADATAAVASGSAAVFFGVSSSPTPPPPPESRSPKRCAGSRPPARFSTPCAALKTSHHQIAAATAAASSSMRVWWLADLIRWMSRAKRRSAKKQHVDDEDASTVQLQPEARMKPEEKERKAAFERLQNLKRCITDVESSGEKVFRALVNSRVSLLNILNPSF